MQLNISYTPQETNILCITFSGSTCSPLWAGQVPRRRLSTCLVFNDLIQERVDEPPTGQHAGFTRGSVLNPRGNTTFTSVDPELREEIWLRRLEQPMY